jgi:hypothetical protein
MSSPITQPSAFVTTKVSISQPKALESGGKMAYLNYADSRSLVLQTPSLPSPFGLNVFDKAGPPKYSIDLAMRDYESNTKVKSFYQALSALDEYMIDQGVKNSKLWFKGEKSREVVKESYSPVVKIATDAEGNPKPYPPNIKVQLKKARGSDDFECQFYDAKSKSDPHAQPIKGVPLEELLVKKVEVTALIQCTGVWFAGGKFGLSWKAVQIRLDKVPQGIKGYGFEVEDGEDQAFVSSGSAFASEEFSAPPKKSAPIVEDDSDDEEEAPPAPTKAVAQTVDSDEEEVAAPPVPKKTVVTKKKIVAPAKK